MRVGLLDAVVHLETETHDAEHEDLSQNHVGAVGGLIGREDFAFDEGEDLGLERGMHPEPLEAGEDGRELIAAAERQTNLFDGRELEIRSSKWPKRSRKVPTFAQGNPCFTQCQRGRAPLNARY